MKSTTTKITEAVRAKMLRRPLEPSVTRNSEIAGLTLIVTKRRAFWAFVYQPRGVNPSTGRRWGGGVRHELCEAMMMPVSEARAAALAAKSQVRHGRSPHHEAMASRVSVEAARTVVPTTVAQALDLYEQALTARRQLSPWTRKQSIRYARFACATMSVASLPLAAINAPAIRLMLETTSGSDARRWHILWRLNRFLKWCRKQGLIETNPCDALDRSDRPKPGGRASMFPRSRRCARSGPRRKANLACDLLRFLLLLPLRRTEAAGLRWSEVDFGQGRIRIAADRMKGAGRRAPAFSCCPRHPRGAQSRSDRRPRLSNRRWRRVRQLGPTARAHSRCDRRGQERPGSRDDSIHDTRSVLSSAISPAAFDVDLLDQCLGHTRRGVLGVYQRSARWPERVRALNVWADLILDVVKDSNVTPFPRRANV